MAGLLKFYKGHTNRCERTNKARSQVKMEILLYLCFSFLFLRVFSFDDDSICSSKFNEARYPHLNGSAVHFALHHPRSPCSPAPFTAPLSFSTVLSHDAARVQALSSRLSKSSATTSRASSSPLLRADAVSTPLSKGTSLGVGNYIASISLGTPAKSYPVVVDTGSSLSWVQCSPCRVYCHSQVGSVFDPSASATHRSLPCSSSECGGLTSATLNPPACSASNVCIYEATYGDSSFSLGYLSKDVLTLGNSQRLPGFVFGCGQDNDGLFGRSAGLVGLARNRLSLLYQLAPVAGNAFSYCLPSTSSAGYLSIGSYNPGRFSYTPLVSSSLDDSLYFLRTTGITVAGRSISMPSSTQMIIDSGTVITRLPSNVYDALSGAVAAALTGHPRAPAYSILDTCYVGSLSRLKVPRVELAFEGGAVLRLPAKNVLIDVDESTTCLAFAPSSQIAIIGNTQHQGFSVVYDVGRSRIGFAAGGCV